MISNDWIKAREFGLTYNVEFTINVLDLEQTKIYSFLDVSLIFRKIKTNGVFAKSRGARIVWWRSTSNLRVVSHRRTSRLLRNDGPRFVSWRNCQQGASCIHLAGYTNAECVCICMYVYISQPLERDLNQEPWPVASGVNSKMSKLDGKDRKESRAVAIRGNDLFTRIGRVMNWWKLVNPETFLTRDTGDSARICFRPVKRLTISNRIARWMTYLCLLTINRGVVTWSFYVIYHLFYILIK